jgi:hypothetical protein
VSWSFVVFSLCFLFSLLLLLGEFLYNLIFDWIYIKKKTKKYRHMCSTCQLVGVICALWTLLIALPGIKKCSSIMSLEVMLHLFFVGVTCVGVYKTVCCRWTFLFFPFIFSLIPRKLQLHLLCCWYFNPILISNFCSCPFHRNFICFQFHHLIQFAYIIFCTLFLILLIFLDFLLNWFFFSISPSNQR